MEGRISVASGAKTWQLFLQHNLFDVTDDTVSLRLKQSKVYDNSVVGLSMKKKDRGELGE